MRDTWANADYEDPMQPNADTEAIDDDAALLAAFVAGDPMAARQLANRHLPRVYGLALRLLGNSAEAEDVAQEAMLRLWKFAPDWEAGRAQLGSWLYRVTSNLATDRLRARKRHGHEDPDALDLVPDQSPGVEAQMIASQRDQALHSAIGQLPERQRRAITLRHLEQLSQPEVAALMDTTVEAVESLLGRARRALVAMLTPKDRTGGAPEIARVK
tara:strand:- start:835 stop:1479 length:645 start_codon:yes stop_codon:yes gene_type:complete